MPQHPPRPYWPEVLTDWCVIRALEQAGCPSLLDASGELQAAFVSEVSAYVRLQTLALREAQAESRLIAAAEATCERMGGVAYGAARAAVESAQRACCLACARAAAGSSPANSKKCRQLQADLQRCTAELAAHRRRAQPAVRQAQHETAKAFWNSVDACRVPDDFFAEIRPDSVLAILPFRHATWWGLFVQCLRHLLARSNPAYSHLLVALPQLRVEAARPGQILVLSAVVQEWREAHGERLGLLQDVHFPVLEQRSLAKLRVVEQWFEACAPGYRRDPALREAAAERLCRHVQHAAGERFQRYWNN